MIFWPGYGISPDCIRRCCNEARLLGRSKYRSPRVLMRILSLLAVILSLATIALGTYVRVTDAGIGCPDWPGCFGLRFDARELAMSPQSSGTSMAAVTGIQLGVAAHRYLAGAVGICILILSPWVWILKDNRIQAVFLSSASMTMVILQGLLRIWVPAHRSLPIAVAGHVLVGFLILLLLFLLYLTLAPTTSHQPTVGPVTRTTAWLALLLIVTQLSAGGWVGANQAGLACPDFSGCLGQLWSDSDFRAGFCPRNIFAHETDGNMLPLPARAAIHWVHRLGGLATLIVLTTLAIRLSLCRHSATLRKAGFGLAALVLMQTGLGVGLILLRLPILIEVAHSVMAGVLLLFAAYVCRLVALGRHPGLGLESDRHRRLDRQRIGRPPSSHGGEGAVKRGWRDVTSQDA